MIFRTEVKMELVRVLYVHVRFVAGWQEGYLRYCPEQVAVEAPPGEILLRDWRRNSELHVQLVSCK